MTDEPPQSTPRAWLNRSLDPLRTRLAHWLRPPARTRQDLIRLFHEAERQNLVDNDAAAMLEGALLVSEMKVLDIMIPRAEMVFIEADATPAEFLPSVIESAHSRFPVYEGERENVIGILLAKDLLKLQRAPELNIRALLRPAVFVPESKGLNDLLRQFRDNRNHLAIVIDEYGRTAGLITIEDEPCGKC
jgi:magnesium and cobalt transporter